MLPVRHTISRSVPGASSSTMARAKRVAASAWVIRRPFEAAPSSVTLRVSYQWPFPRRRFSSRIR
jgi:hypothetical protein